MRKMETNVKPEVIDITPVKVNANSLRAYAVDTDAMLRVCNLIYKSGMAPAHFNSAEKVYVTVLIGQELGFSPMQSLQNFAVIKGKVAPYASALQAVAVSEGGIFTVTQSSDDSVTVKAERRSNKWSDTVTFTIADAKKAELLENPSWRKYPKQMMYARATTILARRGWPDRIGGLKTAEEVEEIEVSVVESSAHVQAVPADKMAKALTEQQKNTMAAMAENRAHAYDSKLLAAALGAEGAKKDLTKAIREQGAVRDAEANRIYCVTPITRWAEYLVASESPENVPDWAAKAFSDEVPA